MKHLQRIQQKIVQGANASQLINGWKQKGESVVFTNGCFDLLHLGHITYLSQTADLADRFVIGVNSDDSVKRLDKSPSRPIKDEYSRMLILASLSFVDAVILFDEDTPYELIQQISPHVLVKGGDYDPNELDANSQRYIVGSDLVRGTGGRVETIEFVPGYSSSKIEQKIIDESR